MPLNGVKYAKAKNYHIKYWEIGNELSVAISKDQITKAEYINLFNDFASAMKAEDPTIKVGVGAGFNYFDVINSTPECDFVVPHQYASSAINDYPSYKNYSANIPVSNIEEADDAINSIPSTSPTFAKKNSMEILVTEFSSYSTSKSWLVPGTTTGGDSKNTLLKSMYTFEMLLNSLKNHDRIKYMNFWTTHSPFRNVGYSSDDCNLLDANLNVLPQGKAIELFNTFREEQMLNVDQIHGYVRSYAMYNPGTKGLSLFLINKNDNNTTVNINLSNYTGGLGNSSWEYRSSTNDPYDEAPEIKETGYINAANGSFSLSLSPVSIKVIHFTNVAAPPYSKETFQSGTISDINSYYNAGNGWTFGSATPAVVVNNTSSSTSTSLTYSNPSGGNNILLPYDPGTTYNSFTVSGINTSSYTTPGLTFGMRRSTNDADDGSNLKVSYSTDGGQTFVDLDYGDDLLPSNSQWILRRPKALPKSLNLVLKFTNLRRTLINYRIDDIMIGELENLPSSRINPITFNPIDDKFLLESDFNAGVTSVNTSTPIVYQSSNTAVASISNGTIHLAGPGTVTITASQSGNYYYYPTSVSRTFAVTNVKILSPTADSYVKDGSSASTNFGTSNILSNKNDTNPGFYRESFLKFDLSSLAGGIVSSATLKMTVKNASAAATLTAFQVSDTWTETGIIYNNKPVHGNYINATAVSTTSVAAPFTMDFTNHLSTIIQNAQNASFCLMDATTNHDVVVDLYSKEDATVSNRPTLEVVVSKSRSGTLSFANEDTKLIAIKDNTVQEVSVFPNPVSSTLMISVPAALNQKPVLLYDSVGKLKISGMVKDGRCELNVLDLTPRIYILKINNGSSSIIQKVIKN